MSSAHGTRACANCGDEFRAFPRNRKYCNACQCLRDLNFRRGTVAKCDVCNGEFYPIRTSYKTCYSCADWRGGVREAYPVCGTCGKRNRTAPGVTKTCAACVMSTREMQARYYATLRKVIADRLAARKEPL